MLTALGRTNMSLVLREALSKFEQSTETGVIFQGVTCHPVFLQGHSVTVKQFDDFIDLFTVESAENLSEFSARLRGLYYRLLDAGFFDAYLGIHFDVDSVTSYVTVVSNTTFTFDMKLRRVTCAQKRTEFAQTFVDRCSRVQFLRGFGCGQMSARENARYFCFSSVLQEIVQHALALQTRPGEKTFRHAAEIHSNTRRNCARGLTLI